MTKQNIYHVITTDHLSSAYKKYNGQHNLLLISLSGVPDYFGRNKISSGGDLSRYSSASLY